MNSKLGVPKLAEMEAHLPICATRLRLMCGRCSHGGSYLKPGLARAPLAIQKPHLSLRLPRFTHATTLSFSSKPALSMAMYLLWEQKYEGSTGCPFQQHSPQISFDVAMYRRRESHKTMKKPLWPFLRS